MRNSGSTHKHRDHGSAAGVNRRLTAILVADVVGYSRLMRTQEIATHEAVQTLLRKTIVKSIVNHVGRIFKNIGDGLLAEFGSVVAAVECAVEIQAGLAQPPAPNAEPALELRIGIDLGDVIVDGKDLFGDGVNVAARLVTIAEPGGICLSGAAFEQVRNKLDLPFKDWGLRSLRNIDEPMRVVHVQTHPRPSLPSSPAPEPRHRPDLPNKPAVAVLPFVALSGKDDAALADALTEDIITELSRFHTLFVFARSTTFAYRGLAIELNRLHQDIGSEYAVEGSIRRIGDSLRLTTQLVRCRTGIHVWAERYDCRLDELFSVQDRIVGQLVNWLQNRVMHDHLTGLERIAPKNLQAYDLWARGNRLMESWRLEDDVAAERLFRRAIQIDPFFPRAYSSLAGVLNSRRVLAPGSLGNSAMLKEAFSCARKAVELDPTDARSHLNLAWSFLLDQDFIGAAKHFELAGELNPNDADIAISRAQGNAFLGQSEIGMALARHAIRLNAIHPDYYHWYLTTVYLLARQFAEATATIANVPSVVPEIQAWHAIALGNLGRLDEARRAADQFRADVRAIWCGRRPPDDKAILKWLGQVNVLSREEDRMLLATGLQQAGFAA
jgi:adenylate cyclase